MSFSPKPIFSILLLLFFVFNLQAQNAWINEFHYDNDGGDVGEFVEVVIEDTSTYDLSLFTVHLYNGNNGESYGSHSLDSFVAGDTESGFTIFYKNISGIQNGAPDGFSLDYQGSLLHFISYEGAFTGVGGPADGQFSEDLLVEEITTTPIGESIQLTGSGTAYSDFSWLAPDLKTKGQLNNGQTLGATCASPTIQASFSIPLNEEIGDNQISLNWSKGDGDGVLILIKESSAVNESPQNGTAYTADADFSSGLADVIGTGNFVVYDGTDTSVNITGLTQGTEYHFAIFEYLTTNQCYLKESETIFVTTTTSFDADSEINTPSTQIPSIAIPSIANSEAEAVEVFKFDVSDLGTSDGVPTLLNTIMIEKSAENTVKDWSTVIKGAKLNDGVSNLTISNLSINPDNIEFDLAGNEFPTAEGGTETLTLSIWLNETQFDGDTLGFEIPENHSFGADVNGSLLNNPIAGTITSNSFRIEVEATDFEINTVSNALVNEVFNLSVRAVDVNGNTDLATRNISLTLNTGNGNLISPSGGLGPLNMNNGFYEWTDLAYDTQESIIIEVSDGNGLSVNTPQIDIIPLITSVFISEYIEGSSSNKALEVFNNSGGFINLANFSLAIYTNGSETISYEYQLSNIQDSLADQQNLVIANTSADSILQEIADTTQFSITNFNGDDALALLYKGNIIDVIGEIGIDPGTAWEVAGVSEATQDKTLVRKASITEGNPNNLASFGSSHMNSEWVIYDTDEFSYLGNHFRCAAPKEQITGVSIQNITESTVELNWTAPTDLNSIVLIKEGNAVDFPPISGNTYTANPDFNLADELGVGNKIVFAGNGENVNISNLTSGTSYHIAIYAYDGAENCYNLDTAATANFTTAIALDEDSQINDLLQPVDSSLLSTIDEEIEAQDVFSFTIADLATNDTAYTFIEKMVFESAATNSLAWGSTLNLILKDGNGKINNAEFTIVDDSIKIDFPENEEYEIPSGQSVDFTLAIWFNRFEVNDTQQFALQIPTEHEFVSSVSGSMLVNTLIDSISSNEIEIIEAFDRIEDIRNGINGTTYVTTGYVSSNDFGIGNTEFYIQKDESTTYEQGISIYSVVEIPNILPGNKVKVLGVREDLNGSIRINVDTVIILNNEEILPETYSIFPSDLSTSNELIGTRVQFDSMTLVQPDLWGDFTENVIQFTNANDTVLVKIEPNNIYFDGNAQLPFGAVDLNGILENRNDSIQLIVSLDNEITDSYSPIFETEPQILNVQGETVDLSFTVNELSSVYYAVKNIGDSIPDLQTLKNPQSDAQIISYGNEKIEIENAGNSISVNIQNLTSNTEYSVFIVAEDTLGNANQIRQLDFFTLNTNADYDVTVLNASEQISATEINAFDASQNFEAVFNFTLVDGGTSDSLSTFVNQMVIHSSAENEVDFSEVLSEVELYDLSNEGVINTQNSIFTDSIVFEFEEIFELNDGDSNNFQLKIKLNEIVEDEQNLVFEIPANQTAWQLEPYGSQLADNFNDAVISSVHSIDVVPTELNTIYPNEVYVGEEFNIEISLEDGNGNIDKAERTMNIVVDSVGELSGQTELNLINGQGIFDSLSFDQTGLFSFEITDGILSETIEINFIQSEIVLDTAGFNSDFGLVNFSDSSEIQSYQLSAENLKDSILVVAPEPFQISLSPEFTDETDTLVFEKDSFSISEIFVRFMPNDSSGEFYQANILHLSRDADTILLPLSGQEGILTLSTIASVRNKLIGERVKTKGVVIGGNNHFEEKRIIQDETGGIAIQGLNSANLNFGDSVEVEGILTEEDGWLSLIPETEISTLSSDSVIVDPLLKSLSEIDISLEFQRIRIENLDISEEGLFAKGEYFIFDDNSDSLIFKLNDYNHPLVGTEIPIGKVNVTGFISRRNDTFLIYPEFVEDLEIIPRDTVLTIEAPEDGLFFGNISLDEFSEPQSYSLEAENLPENLRISTNENFEFSLLENSNYANELELPINERGDIPEIRIYVRFSPIAARGGEISGEIVHVSGGQTYSIGLKGIEEIITSNPSKPESIILIYPNPVDSELKIELLKSGNYQYQLTGIDGVKILEGKLSSRKVLQLDGLEIGIYLLKISNESNNYHFRILKK
ncbi:lamin tail domain-containing protein [Marivirga sp.]|uniref:lamin tail domain-containing protein n=1 Tax=Marivirga sp. TaxID=2018662 RepID=UPI0025E7C93C|nr:lamin tail domain-containing protein [Marivirga sp.]